jgi:L-serine dehydratase
VKTSLFEIFKIGLGPSSSHTVGPMKAAKHFADNLPSSGVHRVQAHLFGSLALTGKGHGTDRAIQLGLSGHTPQGVEIEQVESILRTIREHGALPLAGGESIPFDPSTDLVFHMQERMPDHPNGMRLDAYDAAGELLASQGYYSVGGGAVVQEGQISNAQPAVQIPHPYSCADELLSIGEAKGMAIWEIGLANELALHTREEVDAWLQSIWNVMQECVQRGLSREGVLPGGLNVQRRAAGLNRKLQARGEGDPLGQLDWVDAFAMAVNEENASGGRVVTAPTNGAAGIIPAVAHYYRRFVPGASDDGLWRFFLTAAVIGALYKENASISGADVGCQGEVGVASSMAAGGLVAAMGGSNRCVEKAAEIAMEHNLGMTCDPIGGLVQIPCIERNAMGAVKAINASRIAMLEGGAHKVSLDKVIATMLQTGKDMRSIYKETSQGGLAVNVPLC